METEQGAKKETNILLMFVLKFVADANCKLFITFPRVSIYHFFSFFVF